LYLVKHKDNLTLVVVVVVVVVVFSSKSLIKIILLFFYGCETWSLTWREEHKLQVFENRVLRKMFGHEKDEVSEQFRINIVRNFVICMVQHLIQWVPAVFPQW